MERKWGAVSLMNISKIPGSCNIRFGTPLWSLNILFCSWWTGPPGIPVGNSRESDTPKIRGRNSREFRKLLIVVNFSLKWIVKSRYHENSFFLLFFKFYSPSSISNHSNNLTFWRFWHVCALVMTSVVLRRVRNCLSIIIIIICYFSHSVIKIQRRHWHLTRDFLPDFPIFHLFRNSIDQIGVDRNQRCIN